MESRLTPIIQMIALRLPLTSFLIVPRSMLQKNTQFRPQSTVDFAAEMNGGLRPDFFLTRVLSRATFAGPLTVDQIRWCVYTPADTMIIGRLFGIEALGTPVVSASAERASGVPASLQA